jgi:hypothetical protein
MFTVEDNVDKGRHSKEEIVVRRRARQTTLVWKLSFEELVELQTTIATYIAGERG